MSTGELRVTGEGTDEVITTSDDTDERQTTEQTIQSNAGQSSSDSTGVQYSGHDLVVEVSADERASIECLMRALDHRLKSKMNVWTQTNRDGQTDVGTQTMLNTNDKVFIFVHRESIFIIFSFHRNVSLIL